MNVNPRIKDAKKIMDAIQEVASIQLLAVFEEVRRIQWGNVKVLLNENYPHQDDQRRVCIAFGKLAEAQQHLVD